MYSPPIKYDDFLQKFPTEANAFQFYQKSCGIYCPSCGDKQFSYLRDDKPYMAYCKKCHKEFSILKDTIFVRKETDFRFWLYIGYLHYRMQTDMIIDRLNIAALQRDMQGTTYRCFRQRQFIRIASQNIIDLFFVLIGIFSMTLP